MANLLGVEIQSLTLEQFLFRIFEVLVGREKDRLAIGNVNIHAMNLAYDRSAFREALDQFDIVFCDGFGVKIATALTGQNIPERYTPPDFIDALVRLVSRAGGSVFFLGAAPDVAERAARALAERNPGMVIAGCHHGFFDQSPGSIENQHVIEQINQQNPALLLVAFGMPLQEEWLAQNWFFLNARVALTVGALFDTLSKDVPRAPGWLTDRGLEWLTRLVIEPRRLWRRYLIGIPLFFYKGDS